MKQKLEEGFLDFFTGLEDPRSVRNRKHMMVEILERVFTEGIKEGRMPEKGTRDELSKRYK